MDTDGRQDDNHLLNGVMCIIQARTASTRLPGKVLLELEGKTVLEHVVARVRPSRCLDSLVVATTTGPEDDAIIQLCQRLNVPVFRGATDPLERFYRAALLYRASHIVRIKSDNPLIDHEIVDDAIRLHLESKADYTGNTAERSFPVGEDVEIFTFRTLEKANFNARWFSEREHVTPYIIKHPELFSQSVLKCPQDWSRKRWTIDRPEDYRFISIIFRHLYPSDPLFSMAATLKFLDLHPELEAMNAHIPVDEGLQKSIREDRIVAPLMR